MNTEPQAIEDDSKEWVQLPLSRLLQARYEAEGWQYVADLPQHPLLILMRRRIKND